MAPPMFGQVCEAEEEQKRRQYEQMLASEKETLSRIDPGNRYRIDQIVGQGSYGVVLVVYDTLQQRRCALKHMCISKLFSRWPGLLPRVVREAEVMAHLVEVYPAPEQTRNLPILDVLLPEKELAELYLVLPFYPHSLSVVPNERASYTEDHIKYWMAQLLMGLDELHRVGVVHRDLSPSNVLLDEECSGLRICDFGLARGMRGRDGVEEAIKDTKLTTYVCTRHYRAPELLANMEYSESIDIWSAGCIMAMLVNNGRPAFTGDNSKEQLRSILLQLPVGKEDLKDYPDRVVNWACSELEKKERETSKDLMDFLKQSKCHFGDGRILSTEGREFLRYLLKVDPNERPAAYEALRHPYLRSICAEDSDGGDDRAGQQPAEGEEAWPIRHGTKQFESSGGETERPDMERARCQLLNVKALLHKVHSGQPEEAEKAEDPAGAGAPTSQDAQFFGEEEYRDDFLPLDSWSGYMSFANPPTEVGMELDGELLEGAMWEDIPSDPDSPLGCAIPPSP